MPIIVAWIGRMIATSIGEWLLSALLAVGIGFIANKAGVAIIDKTPIMTMFKSSGLWNWVSYLMIDQDISIVVSAWAGRALADHIKVNLTKLPSAVATGGTE